MSGGQALTKRAIRITALRAGVEVMTQIFQHTPIRIGRLLENDFILPFDFISRHHCEIRFDGEAWRAFDLGSKNGLLLNDQTSLREINLQEHQEFRIQEITFIVDPDVVIESEVQEGTFTALRDAATVVAPLEEIVREDSISDISTGNPILNVDLNELIFQPHPMIYQGNRRSIQMTVIWHDQILDVTEFAVGQRLLWEWQGTIYDLGSVKVEKTKVAIPRGCKPAAAFGKEKDKHLIITISQPAAFQIRDELFVYLRYVPRGPRPTPDRNWLDQNLVNPLITSGAVHGAIAVATVVMGPSPKKFDSREEPERFAKIIVAPQPMPVAAVATPTPTPVPKPTPPPKQIAKRLPPPPRMVKRVEDMKKRAPVALAKKEVAVEKAIEKKPDAIKKTLPPKKADLLTAKIQPAKPAPTPIPFQPKSVGALAMLSALKAGPANQMKNVEKIQIARTPADSPTSTTARDSVKGTGEIISKLNQSAKGNGLGSGDAEKNVAVGGKASASYQTAGLSNQSGKRSIRGSVIGGATYSELNKTEGLRRSEVMKVVQSHQNEIQQCYETALLSNPDLGGRAEFEWEISALGSVTFVKVKESSVAGGNSMLECVKAIFKKMKFPRAGNGETTTPTIGLPFGRER